MASVQDAPLYCRYCGSTEVMMAQMTANQGKSTSILPNMGLNLPSGAGFTLGGVGVGSSKDASLTFTTPYCVTCLNVYAADRSSVQVPLIIVPKSGTKMPIVIPYNLMVQLLTLEYSEPEIHELAAGLIDRLNKIHKKWSKKGNNPCKCNRMGQKLKIELKRKTKIMCWVIIDRTNAGIVYRLAYGGGKVRCP